MRPCRHLLAAVVLVLGFAAPPARAGIPVFDATALQEQVLHYASILEGLANDLAVIDNQIRQYTNMVSHLDSVTGVRGLATALDDPRLDDYYPSTTLDAFGRLAEAGDAALTASASTLRNASRVYECGAHARDPVDRARCEARFNAGYAQQGLAQDALAKARERSGRIRGLMQEAGTTTDLKGAAEIDARIGAENAQLLHEMSQAQLAEMIARAQELVQRSQADERFLAKRDQPAYAPR